jgi:hypothetical protein
MLASVCYLADAMKYSIIIEQAVQRGISLAGEIFDYSDLQQARKRGHIEARSLVYKLADHGRATLILPCAGCQFQMPHSGCADTYSLKDGTRFTARTGMML